jgi:hypothetical protein
MSFQEKYLKYKNKYLTLKNKLESNQYGGTIPVGTIVSFETFEVADVGNGKKDMIKVKKYGKVLSPVNKLNIGIINNIGGDEIISQEYMLESNLTVVSLDEVDKMRADEKKRIEEIKRAKKAAREQWKAANWDKRETLNSYLKELRK